MLSQTGTLKIKELFPTIQGEGSLAGTPAVFVRLVGCNGWTGRGKDRANGPLQCSKWCDTEFRGGKTMTPNEVVADVLSAAHGWPHKPLVVLTGGEPLLWLRKPAGARLVALLVKNGCKVAVETNGTIGRDECPVLEQVDHITVSPKPKIDESGDTDHILLRDGTDIKVIVPTPFSLDELDAWAFANRYVQPMDTGDRGSGNGPLAVSLAQQHGWRVSVQGHKHLGVP